MNTISTASTRPRLSCGVTSGTSVERMNTLTASAPDSTISDTSATTKLVVTPRTMVPTPNSATEARRIGPTRRRNGRNASTSVTPAAPTPIAARSQPSPTAPTARRSSAIAGRSATAPPKSTAKRSSVIAPNRIGSERTKRRPSMASLRPGRARSGRVATGRGCTKRITTAPTTTSAAPTANGMPTPATYRKPPSTGPKMADACHVID